MFKLGLKVLDDRAAAAGQCHWFVDRRRHGRFQPKHSVDAAQVAGEPVVRSGGGDACELLDRGRLALGGQVAVVVLACILQLGFPAALQVAVEVCVGPGLAVAGDDVAQNLESVAPGPAAGSDRDRDEFGLFLLDVVPDFLLRPEPGFPRRGVRRTCAPG